MQNKEFFCTDCGQSNPIGFLYCAKCGRKFSYTCPDCNCEVNPDIKYCVTCGAELIWNVPAGTTVATQSSDQHAVVIPVEIKKETGNKKSVENTASGKQKKRKVSPVPWIIILILIIIIIVLLLNLDSLLK